MVPKEIQIFGPIISPFVVKVLAAARYKKMDYTHQEQVSIRELSKLNPATGKVPVVCLNGEIVYDSTLILRRFDEVKPEPALVSVDSKIAAKQWMLEDWSDESFYWYNQALRWSPRNESRTIAQNSRFVPVPVRLFAKPLLRRLVGNQPNAQGLGRLPYSVLCSEFGKRLDDLVSLLGDSEFFFSQQPSCADFAVYGVFCTGYRDGVTPEFPEEVSARPTLLDWFKRMEEASQHLTRYSGKPTDAEKTMVQDSTNSPPERV